MFFYYNCYIISNCIDWFVRLDDDNRSDINAGKMTEKTSRERNDVSERCDKIGSTVPVRFRSAQTDVMTGRGRKNHHDFTPGLRCFDTNVSPRLTRQTICVCARDVCTVKSMTNNGMALSAETNKNMEKKNDDGDV